MLTNEQRKELTLTTLSNRTKKFSGMDSLEKCLNYKHFVTFNKQIDYKFNSLGFRDEEWPDNIENQIWCIGDSFTLGLGQPYLETWSKIIEQKLGQRTINFSMDGASNNWIARKSKFISENFKPKVIFVLWSYLHRRENPNTALLDEDRIMHYDLNSIKDVDNFKKCIEIIKDANSKIISSFIPQFSPLNLQEDQEVYTDMMLNGLNYFEQLPQIDRARDYHHFGLQTSTQYANMFIDQM